MPKDGWYLRMSGLGRFLLPGLLSCLLFISFHPIEIDSAIVGETTGAFRLVSSSVESVVLEFVAPAHTLTNIVVGEQTFTQVNMPGLARTGEPGKPQLLQTGAWIGLPATSIPSIHVLDIERSTVHLEHPVYPAPVPIPVGGDLIDVDQVTAPSDVFAFDRDVYALDDFYPQMPAAISADGWLRDHRIGLVQFWPVRYHPVRAELDIIQRIVIEVKFHSQDQVLMDASGTPSLFDNVLQSSLLNYETARQWKTSSLMPLSNEVWNAPATLANSYKVMIEDDGLYELTFADLQSAGLPAQSLDPRKLQLFYQGQEVAVRVTGQADGVFDPTDKLFFYGTASRSRYTKRNVYWLRYGDAKGLRMGTRDVSPGVQPGGLAWSTARYEENLFYDSNRSAADGDHWYAAKLMPEECYTAVLDLMPLATSVSTSTLRVLLVGDTSDLTVQPDHHVLLSVNGHPVGEWLWDGTKVVTATLPLNRSVLHAGTNTVDVFVPGDTGAFGEAAWLDGVEIDYAFQSVTDGEATFSGQSGDRLYQLSGFANHSVWLYDVINPLQPVLLQGHTANDGGDDVLLFSDNAPEARRYFALGSSLIRQPIAIEADTPSDLHNVDNRADYLVITHADFSGAVRPLVAYRRAQGLRVVTVDVQDVYDEFNGGLFDPNAIRDFVRYVYAHWTPPALTFVLLVGDGHYDFLNHFGYDSANYIPPYLGMVDPKWGETAADNRYAAISGADLIPDVLLGRLPVNSVAEAKIVVQKILDYEQSPWLGNWNARHVFVADNTDTAGNFGTAADAVYNRFVTDPWAGDKVYLDALSVEIARQKTLSTWNQGALLVSFVGHSSWHQWAHENLLDIHDIPDLENGSRLPVLLSMTCFTGFFHHPEYGTLDELLLRSDRGGAVATWSPSGLGINTGHQYLHRGFYQAVFENNETRVGAAALAAKLYLYSQTPIYNDLLDTYHLFGDPAMAFNLTIRPWPYSIYIPLAEKNASGG
ncbi:MAG: hypothetical protein JXA89_20055 [Anaerolineae bacterium]|nr:hypothetical protein [Anaerolineae bacterium]